jgi:hypothetical protein
MKTRTIIILSAADTGTGSVVVITQNLGVPVPALIRGPGTGFLGVIAQNLGVGAGESDK